jgi:putative transposase
VRAPFFSAFGHTNVGLAFVSGDGMARRHRIRFCGATYHVMARGNRKQPIFVDDVDRSRLLKIVAAALEKFGAECYAHCLMNNHFHKIIHTPRANIHQVMHHIDGLYTQYENWRHRTTGHVLEGRYVGILIDDTYYLRNAIGYVFRNPVAANLVTDPGDWAWSSYNAAMGKASPKFVTTSWLPLIFPAETLDESRRQLAEYVLREPEEYADLVRAAAEGPHAFKKRVRDVIGATLHRARLPRSYRAMAQPPLSEIFAGVKRAERRRIILRAHVVHGYLLTEIANYLDLHPTTVSRIVNQTGSYRLTRD